MMHPKQFQASDPAQSVWVSASAGTGKTKILTDRVLRLLLQGIHPSRILCLTFTKAAAAEMASRIQSVLGSWVMMPQSEISEQLTILTGNQPTKALCIQARTLLAHMLDLPDGFHVQTIHGFCQSLMHRFPVEAGIAPHFQLMDDRASQTLIEEMWQQVLNTSTSGEDTQLTAAIDYMACHKDDQSLLNLVTTLLYKREEMEKLKNRYGDINHAIEAVYTLFGLEPADTPEHLTTQLCCLEPAHEQALRKMILILETGTKTDQQTAQHMAHWLAATTEERKKSLSDYTSCFLTKTGEPKKRLLTKKLQGAHPEALALLTCEQERIIKKMEQIKSAQIAQASHHLLYVAEKLHTLYLETKQKRAYLDYDDLIAFSIQLLEEQEISPWILYKLDYTIEHILLDEAQDTSPQQWQIITALCDEFFTGETDTQKTLFVVGDTKQSIFSFQGADPKTFQHYHDYFKQKACDAKQRFAPISLDRSFRSTEAVLKVVDHIFTDESLHLALSPAANTSPEPIEHKAHRNEHPGCVSLWPLIDETHETEELEPWALPTHYERPRNPKRWLAELITSTIANWLSEGRMLQSKARAITPGDILVLVRKRDEFIPYLIGACKKLGIPVAGVDRIALLDELAIEDLLVLGDVLLLPQDDLSLATVLKSPFIGMDEEELFELAYDRGELSLWERLFHFQKHTNPTYLKAYAFLANLLKKVDHCTPYELYHELLNQHDGRKRLYSRLGLEIEDALDEFLTLAQAYESQESASLQGFLEWIRSSHVEIKRDMEQSQNQIRIMTVHASKGLQAPIVFLPDTTQLPDSKEMFLWDEKEKLFFWPLRSEMHNDHCSMLKEQHKHHIMQEYNRLLYVALTRAEDELIITGSKPQRGLSPHCWYESIRHGVTQCGEETVFTFPDAMTPYMESNIGLQFTSGGWQPNQSIQTVDTQSEKEQADLPDFLFRFPPEEEAIPLLRPSTVQDDDVVTHDIEGGEISDTHARTKGSLIHRLLEHLPNFPHDEQAFIAETFLAHFGNNIPLEEQTHLIDKTLHILQHPDFAWLFTPTSHAEVAVAGHVEMNGKTYHISGQIDRLVITDEKVIIVDYKTSKTYQKNVKDVPHAYYHQLLCYQHLIKEIYPDKPITTGILWVEGPEWMPLQITKPEVKQPTLIGLEH